MSLKLSWSGWMDDWFYLSTNNALDNLRVPSAPALVTRHRRSTPKTTTEQLTLVTGVKRLGEVGLTGSDVVHDFVKSLSPFTSA